MKTLNKLMKKGQTALFLLIMLVIPTLTFAQEKLISAEEERAQADRIALIAEVSIGVIFVAAVTAFLIYKAKHDKKVREQQMEQMKRVQAAKRKAA